MNLVNRLIVREMLGPVLNGVIIFTFVLLAPTFFSFTEMLTRGVAPAIVMKMVVLTTPMLVTQAAPMGMLLGTIAGLNASVLTFIIFYAFGAATVGAFRNLPLTYAGGLAIGRGRGPVHHFHKMW